jgi:hypothetical protein
MPDEYGPPYNNRAGNGVSSGKNTDLIQKLLDMLSSSPLGGIGDAVSEVASNYDRASRGARGLPVDADIEMVGGEVEGLPADMDVQAAGISVQGVEGGGLSDSDHQQLMLLLDKSGLPSEVVDLISSQLGSPAPSGLGLEEAGFEDISQDAEENISLEDEIKKLFGGGGR